MKTALLFGLAGAAVFGVGMWADLGKLVIVGVGLFAVGLVHILDRRIIVVVSAAGIRYAVWGRDCVPWEEFSGFRVVSSRLATVLQLVPKDPEVLLRRLSAFGRINDWTQRLFPQQPRFGIPIHHLAGPKDEVMARLRLQLPELPAA